MQKNSFLESFSIKDRTSCEKAIRNGGIAAMVSAVITAIFAGIGFFTGSSDKELAYILDPWMIIDVVLIVILGAFIFQKSRVAATLMVVYFIVSKAIMWYEMGRAQGVFMSIIFFLFFVTAMRGTYIWHNAYKHESSKSVA
jgi:hypothetical protein